MFDLKTIGWLKNKVQSAGFIDLPADGNSMFPYIRNGEICSFIPVIPAKIKKGDIVLYYSGTGHLIAHRFCYCEEMGDNQVFLLKGDTNLGFDQPIKEEQIMGVLLYVQKRNKKVYMRNLSACIWGWLVLSIPVISQLLRNYLNKKNEVEI